MQIRNILLTLLLALTCLPMLGCNLIDQIPPPKAPMGVLVAPAGAAFVVADANSRCYLAPVLNLAATVNGVLCSQNGMIIKPQLTLPAEARFLRIQSDGRVEIRQEGDNMYILIGQLQVARATPPLPTGPLLNTAAIQMVSPDGNGVGPLDAQMFAITRQGDRIRFVPMQYGQ